MNLKEEKLNGQIKEYIGETSNTVEKGRNFLNWVLFNIFDKAESELDEEDISSETGVLIVDGNGDKGIDAAFVYKSSLHVIQTKYGLSHSEDNVHAFIAKMANLLEGSESAFGPKIKDVHEIIFDNENNINDIQLFYITDNMIIAKNFEYEVKKFEESVSERCGKNCRMKIMGISEMVNYIDNLSNSIPSQFQGKKSELLIEKYFENKEHTTIVAEVALKNLARFIKKDKDYLYYSNIRNFLGKSGKINKKMVDTFRESPKSFWYYNNGITIVCDNYEAKSESRFEITTPQIVNGCQTANVIFTEWNSIKDKQVQNQVEGTILVKIIKDTNNKRTFITKYTNSQNAVTGKDFFALESFHKGLKKAFEGYGYNYETQRNADILKTTKPKIKGNIKYNYLFDKNFIKKNTIIAKESVQAYVAGILLKPAKAKSIGDYVPGGKYYDETFNDSTPIDPRCYLFPYAIVYYGNNTLNHKNNDKQRASNLLFVSIYFRLITSILRKTEIIPHDITNINELNSFADILDIVFRNQLINKELINYADQILMDQIFDDTIINEMIGDNLPKFLKNTIDTERCIKIINDKIENRINKPNMQEFIKAIKNLYL
ncbi:AIPR family protein [Clostridium polynesiense]|uniref:AIPR family protein n=1 Tax=Clostridium polynesiense TaxID=1325933 RepID=UPI00058DCA0E|nr:AIPR family protein [Clostridium polynesiense]